MKKGGGKLLLLFNLQSCFKYCPCSQGFRPLRYWIADLGKRAKHNFGSESVKALSLLHFPVELGHVYTVREWDGVGDLAEGSSPARTAKCECAKSPPVSVGPKLVSTESLAYFSTSTLCERACECKKAIRTWIRSCQSWGNMSVTKRAQVYIVFGPWGENGERFPKSNPPCLLLQYLMFPRSVTKLCGLRGGEDLQDHSPDRRRDGDDIRNPARYVAS